MAIICQSCGEKNDDDDILCSECGMRLAESKQDSTNAIEQPTEQKNASSHTTQNGDLLEARDLSIKEEFPKDIALPENQDELLGLTAKPMQESTRSDGTTSRSTHTSDCKEFKIDWNQGTSQFISGIGSSLEFEVTPINSSASHATDFKMFLKFPNEQELTEQKLQYVSISRPVKINVNYRPAETLIGVNQAVELYFSYVINGKENWFTKQLSIDIYPSNQATDKVIENFNIRIDSIHQEGKAGDPNLSLFENLKLDSSTKIEELLKELKNSDALWDEIEFIQSHKPETSKNDCDKTEVLKPTDPRLKSSAVIDSLQNEGKTESTAQQQQSNGSGLLVKLGVIAASLLIVIVVILAFFVDRKASKTTVGAAQSVRTNQATIIENNIVVNTPAAADNKVEKLLTDKVKDLDSELQDTEDELEKMKQSYNKLDTRRAEQLKEAAEKQQIVNSARKEIERRLAIAKTELETRDSDKDGILDKVEKKLNLDPNNPNDAKQDNDNDGFNNKTEILGAYNNVILDRSTDHNDPQDHPSLSYRLELMKPTKPQTLFMVKEFNISSKETKNQNVTIQYKTKTGSEESIFKVYDSFEVDGQTYTISDIKVKKKKVFNKALWKELEVSIGELEVSSKSGTRTLIKGDKVLDKNEPQSMVKDSYSGAVYPLALNKQITLGDKRTGEETFKVINISDNYVEIKEIKSSKSFVIRASARY